MNIRLVKFAEGKYGVRKGIFFYKFYDFNGTGYCDWRGRDDSYFADCVTSYETALEKYNLLVNVGTVIK